MTRIHGDILFAGFFTVGFAVWFMMGRPRFWHRLGVAPAPQPDPPPDAPFIADPPQSLHSRFSMERQPPPFNEKSYLDNAPAIGAIVAR